jgi:hypothetical protein
MCERSEFAAFTPRSTAADDCPPPPRSALDSVVPTSATVLLESAEPRAVRGASALNPRATIAGTPLFVP